MGLAAGVLVASAAGVAVAAFTGANVVFPVHVTSNSMVPYATRGDYGIAIRSTEIRHGDVIVFRFPFGASTLAIKRAVILPGECMPPQGDGTTTVRVNPAVPAGASCALVPEGAAYVVGDNISGSIDSRHFGVVPATEIVGKVVLVVPVTRWLARWRAERGASSDNVA